MRIGTRRAVAIITASSWVSSSALAFTPTGATWPSVPVAYVVNPRNHDMTESEAIGAIAAAAESWSNRAGSTFAFDYAGTSALDAIALDGANTVFFVDDLSPSGPSVAATAFIWSSDGRIVDSDVVIWDASFPFFAGASGCSDGLYLQDVMTHEFGHSLGLDHSSVAGATMEPMITICSQAARDLDEDDLAGVATLYPIAAASPAPTAAPTATPTPEPTATPGPSPTPRPTPRPTATPRPTPRPTATPRPTPRPTATPRPTPKPTHPPFPWPWPWPPRR